MKKFNKAFSYYKEETSLAKLASHPFIKRKKSTLKKEINFNYPYICSPDRLKTIKGIKDFNLDFIRQNGLLNETLYLKEVCMMLLKSMEFKSLSLKKHIIAVSKYSAILANKIDLSADKINEIEIGGLLHDIGKMSFPDYIFYKSGKLNRMDLDEIKKHPYNGYSILKGTLPENCEEIARIALFHHEKWDGSGYPNQLKGEEIPVGARIVSICDSFDSMIRRKYFGQKIKSVDEALTIFEEDNNGQWDSDLVKVFINMITKDNYALHKQVQNI